MSGADVLGGTRNMTVAYKYKYLYLYDGCWRAGWGACNIETGDVPPAPTERRETRTVASVLRVTVRAARCFSFSTCRSYCGQQRARA
jgi:hypothetical protein